MKKFLLINILLLSVSFAFAQELVDNDSVCSFVDERAQFVGGEKELFKWLNENMPYCAPEENCMTGTIYVNFVVEKDGSITNVKVVKGIHKSLDNEAIRIIKLMPNWLPGKQDGKIVRSYFTLPVKFINKN